MAEERDEAQKNYDRRGYGYPAYPGYGARPAYGPYGPPPPYPPPAAYPGYGPYAPQIPAEQELKMLREEAEHMEQVLSDIQERIREIEKETEDE